MPKNGNLLSFFSEFGGKGLVSLGAKVGLTPNSAVMS